MHGGIKLFSLNICVLNIAFSSKAASWELRPIPNAVDHIF